MAGGSKRGGGDRVLESRHLVGLFLGVVLLCGVFFTLGYVMGRTQYGGSVHAETITRKPAPDQPATADPSSTKTPNEWDFYDKKPDAKIDNVAPEKSVAETPAPAPDAIPDASDNTNVPAQPAPKPEPPAVKTPASLSMPRIAKGAILLQVAAMRHQADALTMATLLQQKRFPAFVVPPSAGDSLYRVQVGPYSSESAADSAKGALDHDGFKAIIKR
jgi:DedD protein